MGERINIIIVTIKAHSVFNASRAASFTPNRCRQVVDHYNIICHFLCHSSTSIIKYFHAFEGVSNKFCARTLQEKDSPRLGK